MDNNLGCFQHPRPLGAILFLGHKENNLMCKRLIGNPFYVLLPLFSSSPDNKLGCSPVCDGLV